MIHIYNVTVNVDDEIKEKWLDWIHQHIPEVLGTGRFLSARFCEVLVEEEMGGTTYSIQYKAKSREALDAYYKFDAENLRNDGMKKFAGKFVAFRTELKLIDEYTVNER